MFLKLKTEDISAAMKHKSSNFLLTMHTKMQLLQHSTSLNQVTLAIKETNLSYHHHLG